MNKYLGKNDYCNKEINSQQISSHNDQIVMDQMKAKQYLYDDKIKKKNSFWCSSTFWIPWTKKVPDSITKNISQNNYPRKRPSALQAQEYVLKDDNRYNNTTVNDHINSNKSKVVRTEGNERVKEEFKVKDYATGGYPNGNFALLFYIFLFLSQIHLDNERIHLIIRDDEEKNVTSKRVMTDNNFAPNKKNRDIDKKFKTIIDKDRKIKSAVPKEDLEIDAYACKTRDKARQDENKSISNRSVNSTILENIIGFKVDSVDKTKNESQSREKTISKNNFMVKTNLTDSNISKHNPNKYKSKDKVIGITRENAENYKSDKNKDGIMHFIEEESHSISNPSVSKFK